MMPDQTGIDERFIDGCQWVVFGTIIEPILQSAGCLSWRSIFPVDAMFPMHVHQGQDEFLSVSLGSLDLVVGLEAFRVFPGEVVELPRGVPHGIFNNSGAAAIA